MDELIFRPFLVFSTTSKGQSVGIVIWDLEIQKILKEKWKEKGNWSITFDSLINLHTKERKMKRYIIELEKYLSVS